MTAQAIIILDILGVLLLLWLLDLVRRGRLYVGYGVLFLFTVAVMILVVSISPVLAFVTRAVGAVFPASALTMVALAYLFMMGIYVMTQITVLSERVAEIVQESAMSEVRNGIGSADRFNDSVYPARTVGGAGVKGAAEPHA
ncbi:MAG: DUF2304 domain-containing protein [bacterium]